MGYQVYMGNASKRLNSTMQPDYTAWQVFDVLLKTNTDLEAPVFTLNYESQGFPKFNMLYCPEIGHYYWITDIVSVRRNGWEIHASIDVLATYKNQIINTPAYIEYGFNEDASGATLRIADTRQHIAMAPQVTKQQGISIFGSHFSLTGCYILSAVGANGGVSTYALDQGNLWRLVNTISRDITDELDALVSGVGEPLEAIQAILQYFTPQYLAQGSCIQAIRNCFWIPVALGDVPSSGSSNIYLGDFNTGALGHKLSNDTLLSAPQVVTIPWPVSDWRRMNTQLSLYVPYVGTVVIPVDHCNTHDVINILAVIDCATGDVSIRIGTGGFAYTVFEGSANVARGYAIGSSNVPAMNFLSGAISVVGGGIQAGTGVVGLATGALIPGMASAAGTNIAEGLDRAVSGYSQAVTPLIQCTGTITGSAANGQLGIVELTVFYYPPVDDAGFSAVYGHPVFRVATPVAGYCKTNGFSLISDGRGDDAAKVNAAMDGGVFIE